MLCIILIRVLHCRPGAPGREACQPAADGRPRDRQACRLRGHVPYARTRAQARRGSQTRDRRVLGNVRAQHADHVPALGCVTRGRRQVSRLLHPSLGTDQSPATPADSDPAGAATVDGAGPASGGGESVGAPAEWAAGPRAGPDDDHIALQVHVCCGICMYMYVCVYVYIRLSRRPRSFTTQPSSSVLKPFAPPLPHPVFPQLATSYPCSCPRLVLRPHERVSRFAPRPHPPAPPCA